MVSLLRPVAAAVLPSRTMRRSPTLPLIGLAYIAAIATLGGLKSDHLLIGMLGFLDVVNESTRRFVRTFLPFIATGVVFDSMRYYYSDGIAGRVHVSGPYELERAWFGVHGRTLNELFLVHHWAVADLAAGFAYLTYVVEYLGMAFLLFVRGVPERAATFARCFFVVNVLGFITYFIYPAAPPWYVTAHGLGPATTGVAPSAAAALRFDALVGTHLFEHLYGKSIAAFGAIPSLHVAYPLIAAVLAFRIPALRFVRWPALVFSPLMCFSAIYLQHHYLLDVLVGLAYALVALAIVTTWERRRPAPAS
jgi:membrane-associated phospholipid phosphatase